MKHGRTLTVAVAGTAIAAVLGLWAAQALATTPAGVTPTPLTQGTIEGRIDIKTPNHSESVITFQKLTIGPGGTTGWHSHDAEVIVMVAAGRLTLTEHDCSVLELDAGHGFTEDPGHVHEARNNGPVPVEVYVTYVSRPGALLRVDEADPGCSAS